MLKKNHRKVVFFVRCLNQLTVDSRQLTKRLGKLNYQALGIFKNICLLFNL